MYLLPCRIIHEVYQSPDQQDITSFRSHGVKDYLPYLESTWAPYELPEEEEQKEDASYALNLDWDKNSEDSDLNVFRPAAPPADNLEVNSEDMDES